MPVEKPRPFESESDQVRPSVSRKRAPETRLKLKRIHFLISYIDTGQTTVPRVSFFISVCRGTFKTTSNGVLYIMHLLWDELS